MTSCSTPRCRRITLTILLFMAVGIAMAPAADALPRRGIVGVQLGPVDDTTRTQFDLPGDARGALIAGVMPNTPAAAAGLQPGDVIVRADKTEIGELQTLLDVLDARRAGDTVKLTVQRAGKSLTVSLTLAPRPEESYADLTVEYGTVASRDYRLRTLLTRPTDETDQPRPAIFFIQGLGCFSMENMGLYTPFIERFNELGFVTFRVDKPGCGDSEGGPCQDSDFAQVVDGYRQALAQLRKTPGIDPNRIFIFGHSMGGLIGPILASEESVAGLIVYGTGFRTWLEYVLENNRRQALLEGKDHAQVEADIRREIVFSTEMLVAKKSPAQIIAAHPDLADYIRAQVRDDKYIFGRHYRFFQQLYDVPIAELWRKVDGQVLALYGACDFVVSGVDHELLAAAVNAAHPGHGQCIRLEGTDHWFREVESPAKSFAHEPTGPLNPNVLDTITTWLKDRSKPS